jgi:hypothetical protein
MCISLLLYDAHPSLLLLLTFNRDEFWDRYVRVRGLPAPQAVPTSTCAAPFTC